MTDPEPEPATRSPLSSLSSERRTLKGRPTVVLLVLIGSCYAFGYTIFRLLKGMHQ